MAQTAPCVLSFQNYWENPCMRAVCDGTTMAAKSHPALLGLWLCEMRTETTLLLYKSWLFGQNERHKWTFWWRILLPGKKKKKKGKAQWSNDTMLIDWVGSGCTGKYLVLGHGARTLLCSVRTPWPWSKYFPVQPSHSVIKYKIIQSTFRRPFESCVQDKSIFFWYCYRMCPFSVDIHCDFLYAS